MRNSGGSKLQYSIILLLIVFISSYISISWFNRFSKDDFDFLRFSKENSIFDNVYFFYYNWEGPVGGLLIWFTSLSFLNKLDSPFFFNCITLLIYLAGSICFLKSVLRTNLFIALSIASLISIDLYYNGLAISEVWFWINGNFDYLGFLGIIMLGVSFLLLRKYYWLGVIIFLFVGSMRLNYSAVVLLLFAFILAYKLYHKQKIGWRFYFPLILTLAGTIIYIIAPGNYLRKSNFEISYSLIDIVYNVGIMTVEYLYEFVILKMPYHITILFPISYLLYIQDKTPLKANKLFTKINLFHFTFAALSVLLVHNFILYMAKGGQTARTLIMVSFIFSSYIIYLMTYLLIHLKLKINIRYAYLALVLGGVLLVRRAYLNYPIVKEYAKAVDERTILLLKYKNDYENHPIDTLFLDPLPHSGWLHSSQVYPVNDPRNYSNDNIENYYDLPFKLFGKEVENRQKPNE